MRSFLAGLFFLVFFVIVSRENVHSYRILGVFPHVASSHSMIGKSLLTNLAAKGHQVTMISPFNQTESIKNFRHIHLENTFSDMRKGATVRRANDYFGMSFIGAIDMVYNLNLGFTLSALNSVNFRAFLQENEHFDVVIHEVYICDALIGLGHYFNAPVIGFSTIMHSKWTSDVVGLSDFASHTPNIYNGFTNEMNFWQRMYNSLSYWYEDMVLHWTYYPIQQKLLNQMFINRTKTPSYAELRRNLSIVFVNSHASYGISQPMTPNLIEVGGIHVKQTVEPLTEDVQAFLDGAKHGAIYFSLGSNLHITKLPQKQKQILTNAFSEFPNHRILIKSNKEFDIPSHNSTNILIRDWFNQEAILSHPNVKAFVTHGGLLSTTEAVYFGKPIVGISFLFDQPLNMNLAQQKGYGISILFKDLTDYNLKYAIRQILTNSSYSETAKEISQRFHDQLNTPMERAIYWVEHVAKNKGTAYLQNSGIHLPFYVFYNLDVWTFLIVVVYFSGWILWKLLDNLWKRTRTIVKQKSH